MQLAGKCDPAESLKLQLLVVTNVPTLNNTDTFLGPWIALKMAGLGLCVRVTPGGMKLIVLGIYTRPFKGIEQF